MWRNLARILAIFNGILKSIWALMLAVRLLAPVVDRMLHCSTCYVSVSIAFLLPIFNQWMITLSHLLICQPAIITRLGSAVWQKFLITISDAGPWKGQRSFCRHIEDVSSVCEERSTPLPVGVASRNRTGWLVVGPSWCPTFLFVKNFQGQRSRSFSFAFRTNW